jgi:hypothetical protein
MFGMFCTANVDIVALGHPCGVCNFNLLLLLEENKISPEL